MALTPEQQERLQEQLKELKEGIAVARGRLQADSAKQQAAFSQSAEEVKTKIRDYNAKTADRIETELNTLSRDADVARMILEIQMKEDAPEAMGDLEAVKENVRLAKDYSEGKRNASLLKAQMTLNEIKAARAERLAEMDKTDRAGYIASLLDYADDCDEIAESYLLEAQLALTEAVDEMNAYEKEYGEDISVLFSKE